MASYGHQTDCSESARIPPAATHVSLSLCCVYYINYILKYFFYLKYIKIFFFYFLKFISNINILKQFKNK